MCQTFSTLIESSFSEFAKTCITPPPSGPLWSLPCARTSLYLFHIAGSSWWGHPFYQYSHAYFIPKTTRARAQQFNYQVKLFLAVQTSYPLNAVPLNPCDDFLIIKNLEHEPHPRKSNHDNGQLIQTSRSDPARSDHHTTTLECQFGPPDKVNFGRPKLFTLDVVKGPWVLVGEVLKSSFRWIQPHDDIPPELNRITEMMFGLPAWTSECQFGPSSSNL